MTFYLSLEANKELSKTPLISSIAVVLDGEKRLCDGEILEGHMEDNKIHYRLKGVRCETKSGNWEYSDDWIDDAKEISVDEITFRDEDDMEDFNYKVILFEILNWQCETRKVV